MFMQGRLPGFLSFKSAIDLVRIGRDHDGGYLISQIDIDNSDLLIGLGINDDWSFEEHFVAKKDVEVFAYDGSISQKHFFNQFIKSLTRIDNPKLALHSFFTLLRYRKFFSKKKVCHIEKYIGLNSNNQDYCTLSYILDSTKHENIFLKIDVEGSEYRFLDTLIFNQSRISGVVLELHDCDIHLETIKTFIKDFELKLVHIHANNYSPVRLDDQLPLVLELTFSKYCKLADETYLPHRFDMPNNRNESEIYLAIED